MRGLLRKPLRTSMYSLQGLPFKLTAQAYQMQRLIRRLSLMLHGNTPPPPNPPPRGGKRKTRELFLPCQGWDLNPGECLPSTVPQPTTLVMLQWQKVWLSQYISMDEIPPPPSHFIKQPGFPHRTLWGLQHWLDTSSSGSQLESLSGQTQSGLFNTLSASVVHQTVRSQKAVETAD